MHDDQRKRFQRTWQMLLELERQVARGHLDKERNADRVIKRLDAAMAAKTGGINWTVPKLAFCFISAEKSKG